MKEGIYKYSDDNNYVLIYHNSVWIVKNGRLYSRDSHTFIDRYDVNNEFERSRR